MGHEKDRMILEEEQGWRFRDDDNVCHRCISDPYLREMVRSQASEFECSFCGWHTRKVPNSIPFNALMEVIGAAIEKYYDRAVNCLGLDDESESGYAGVTYDSDDLVRDEIRTPSENGEVIRTIIDSLGDEIWCDQDPYGLSEGDRYAFGWEAFCNTVKHRIRYFFDSQIERRVDDDGIPVPEMLDELREVINEAGLISELPPGAQLYRVRVHRRGERCTDWRALGSPPPELSVSNRMSAAGISAFYAAMDSSTAKAEASANLAATDGLLLTCATWTATRPLKVLNLARLPEIPSFYEHERYDRDRILFLWKFIESITEPVQHDGREHVEYVPSQIVTEYFRHRYRLDGGTALNGIVYPSAQRKRGKSVIVFASQDDLDPDPSPWGWERTPVLTLDTASIRRLKRSRACV